MAECLRLPGEPNAGWGAGGREVGGEEQNRGEGGGEVCCPWVVGLVLCEEGVYHGVPPPPPHPGRGFLPS